MSRWINLGLTAAAVVAMAPQEASATKPTGQISCTVAENGAPATGTMRVAQKDGAVVHSGACAGTIAIAPGKYQVVVGLDGALDGPEQTFEVNLRAGVAETVNADFATGILQVRIESGGQRAAGMAIIRRQGTQLGTLGSGVTAHLSVGTYQVLARYRLRSQEFSSVAIQAGQTTTLDASF